MSANCLEKNIKVAAENNNLKLGELRVPVKLSPVGYENDIRISAIKDITIKVIGNGHIGTAADNITLTSVDITAGTYTRLWFENANYEISISDKYSLRNLLAGMNAPSILGFDLSELKYANFSNLQLIGDYHVGSVNDVKANNVAFNSGTLEGDLNLYNDASVPNGVSGTFIFAGTKFSGNIEKLKYSNSTTTINVLYSNVSGVLSSLASKTNLERVMLNGTKVTGSVESLIDAMKANRSTGTLTITAYNKEDITYTNQSFKTLGITNVTYNFATNQYTTS